MPRLRRVAVEIVLFTLRPQHRFDTFSIDEHATQTLPQEWWGTAFKDAIGSIGHTVMLLAPWDKPVPLTRAWW